MADQERGLPPHEHPEFEDMEKPWEHEHDGIIHRHGIEPIDPGTVKAVLDQIEKDSKTLDHHANELYAETDAKVVEAAKALKSLGLFPRQKVVNHTPTSAFGYAYMDLLPLGEPSTTRPFLHSDGSIVLHRVPWEGIKDEDRIVAPEYMQMIAPKRFPYAREALTRIAWLLETALRDNQPAEVAPQPSAEDLPF